VEGFEEVLREEVAGGVWEFVAEYLEDERLGELLDQCAALMVSTEVVSRRHCVEGERMLTENAIFENENVQRPRRDERFDLL